MTSIGNGTRIAALAMAALAMATMTGCRGNGDAKTQGASSGTKPASATNVAPVISGSPATRALAGQPYSFAPSARDPDSRTLVFSIANAPRWASFDASTGTLSGTPGDADIGSYANVTITVSDGTSSAALAPYTITVAPPPSGWATLSWVAPTQNVDGTPLTDLAGYRIRYGLSPDQLDTAVDIPGSSVTTATIEGLDTGTWYFAVKAYTSASVESDLSNLASKTIT